MQLEELSGVDRTRISRLEIEGGNPTIDTHDKLTDALRKIPARKGGLRISEKLVYEPSPVHEASA
jgi:transcriptional regulator with XRE-family HTH domain